MELLIMHRVAAIWIATTGTLLVATVSLLMMGWGPEGLAAAARNTARFSGIVFALALVSRSANWPALFARRWSLFFAFVAAHGVHFAAVGMVAVFDTGHELHQLKPAAIVTLSGGFGLLLLAALTAGKSAEPFRAKVHTAAFYLLGLIFLVGFGSRMLHAPASGIFFGVVLLAFLGRALPGKKTRAATA
jgi:hypothetical protein